MAKKVKFSSTGIDKVPVNKPIVYTIETAGGRPNYVGIAKRGRAQERLREHLPGAPDAVPGATIKIQQVSTVDEAKQKERALIQQKKPKHNIQNNT
jgi:hypothetical protein